MPAAKNCSASLSVETVMPRAPASSCACTTGRHFEVLTCGRKATPSAFIRSCMRATLRRIRARSTSAEGVSRSASRVMDRSSHDRPAADWAGRLETRRIVPTSAVSS